MSDCLFNFFVCLVIFVCVSFPVCLCFFVYPIILGIQLHVQETNLIPLSDFLNFCLSVCLSVSFLFVCLYFLSFFVCLFAFICSSLYVCLCLFDFSSHYFGINVNFEETNFIIVFYSPGLPPARWQNLYNLEVIKARNKPKEVVNKPKNAPFFLPTITGPDGQTR